MKKRIQHHLRLAGIKPNSQIGIMVTKTLLVSASMENKPNEAWVKMMFKRARVFIRDSKAHNTSPHTSAPKCDMPPGFSRA